MAFIALHEQIIRLDFAARAADAAQFGIGDDAGGMDQAGPQSTA